jgi:3-oxoacyl-[acyl-carrier protein] reductase
MNIESYRVGDRESIDIDISEELIDSFADMSGDTNPLHMNTQAAQRAGFARRVSHGVLSLALLSKLIGTKLPGDGALWRSLSVDWIRPVFAGDHLHLDAEVLSVS